MFQNQRDALFLARCCHGNQSGGVFGETKRRKFETTINNYPDSETIQLEKKVFTNISPERTGGGELQNLYKREELSDRCRHGDCFVMHVKAADAAVFTFKDS